MGMSAFATQPIRDYLVGANCWLRFLLYQCDRVSGGDRGEHVACEQNESHREIPFHNSFLYDILFNNKRYRPSVVCLSNVYDSVDSGEFFAD